MKKTKSLKKYLLALIAIVSISVIIAGCSAEITNRTTTPPTVVSTFPTREATEVAVNGTITATFDESVDAATVVAENFTVRTTGGTAVVGTVTYDAPGKKAIFAPSANLDYDTAYTATITTGVKDLDGTALAEAKVWTFTTVPAGVGPTPVNLGTAANYVILAKTAVSTVPDSNITGNVGLSPAAESYMTGFSQTDATGYATSSQVTGYLYAADMASPTSTNLTTAVSDMEAAYSDAAGRANPDETDLQSGAIGGETLVPGLYKWTSSVTITGTDVTISGGANDIWIFQINGDLSIADGLAVVLAGGASAKNIFWQVSGTVDIGAGSRFKGVILSQANIGMRTGSTIDGRLLAQTEVALDHAVVTEPAL